jgi:hypothetical protein
MNYIQRRGQGMLETVDEFPTYKEARAMLAEYSMSDYSTLAAQSAVYKLRSTRA